MTTFDAEIAGLRMRAGNLENDIHDKAADIAELREELARTEGEIRGLERARELFGEAEPPPARRERHDVEGPVLKCLRGCAANELEIVVATSLPADAVHRYLLRAVRDGKLVAQAGVYRLPPVSAVAGGGGGQ